MKKIIIRIIFALATLYVLACTIGYFFQEKFLFFPEKLEENHQFEFDAEYEEMNISIHDGTKLNGLLFKADSAKGLIFYLHGNGKSQRTYGNTVNRFLGLGYDFFIWDYRGYGKSEGKIKSEKQLTKDAQMVYNEILKRYDENDIVVFGYSLGACIGIKLAAENHPQKLMLLGSSYSVIDEFSKRTHIFPSIFLKYKFETYKYIPKCKMPITIFHGKEDKLIDYQSSLKLQKFFKERDTFILLEGAGHNGKGNIEEFEKELKKILL